MTQLSPAPEMIDGIVTPATTAEVGDYTWHNVKQRLRAAGVRPTRQRMVLAWLLFRKGNRHLTAEMLYEEVATAMVPVSLATVYNTLHQFSAAGLLREIVIDGQKKYFDTNATDHQHFLLEDRNDLLDVPANDSPVAKMPTPPDGYAIRRVDIIFRLQRRQS